MRTETRGDVVPNATGDDWETLRSFTLLQHVRYTSSASHYVYHRIVGFAAMLVLCLLPVASKSNRRHTYLPSRCLHSPGRAIPHSTSPKPIPLAISAVRSDKHQRRGVVHLEGTGSGLETTPIATWWHHTCKSNEVRFRDHRPDGRVVSFA